ncbi:cytochrome c biogenesis protein [Jeotgalibacillus haloalkalitolerans]|uniref:Cytochrome c biogenesis protein CcsA n=1 Tax=Jeotgalibacillus haloalkalitolerans TaxID=3104292 RepID=A0ABU5KNW4_9BACL|nr:cytochrome c biogenesis protein CcsA [Jeotgalibacillus sp. HH7-29]MDZ5712380.1 cytochrome c biogenesis protein CcsA [Jeotgalibacillus sp. HH7-29]
MFELSMTRLHEVMIILYAISVLLYFMDYVQRDQKANRVAFWLLSIVWVLQTIFLFLYMFRTGRFPVLTLFEGIYFYAWVLLTLSLILNRLMKIDFTVFFVNLIGFTFMAIHTFAPVQASTEAAAERLMSELLLIHITMAIVSYAAFSISVVFSILYLLQYRLLKQKKWGQKIQRITDLAKLEKGSVILNSIGFPLLLLSLILGVQWAVVSLPTVLWYDIKISGSFLLLAIYGVFLYRRFGKGQSGKSLALFNTAAFGCLLINFLLGSRLSSFHFWSV